MDGERKLLYTATVLGGVLALLNAASYLGGRGLPTLEQALLGSVACQEQLSRTYAACSQKWRARRGPTVPFVQ